VFRFPKFVMLLSAAVGTGVQILVLTVCILLLALVGTFYPGNRAVYSAALLLYAFNSGLSGYVSTSLYWSLGETKWATNAVLTAVLFPGPFFLVFMINNSVALYYGSSSARTLSTIAIVILLWALVTFPLTIIGALRGRNTAKPYDAPCKTNRSAREIPQVNCFRGGVIQCLVAGFLPFSAIYIELHYMFAAIWGHRVYTLFGILSLAFIMLVVVSAFITIALTYFQLVAEDYRWWWRSFLGGASTGFFMFAYSVFYYFYRTEMSGQLQAFFFFGYMAILSFGFSLMMGAISFFVAEKFVRHIYLSIKID